MIFLNISIRKHIIDNFKDSGSQEIKSSIDDSINDKDEITLPGLGVFFEILWSNCSIDEKNKILNIIEENIKSA